MAFEIREIPIPFLKKNSAEAYYKVLNKLGANIIFNHADFRLMSNVALIRLSEFSEVNLFFRGIVPMIGYKSSCVFYSRKERIAGESKYPLKKMLYFAFEGITSLSVSMLRIITVLGMLITLLSIVMLFYVFYRYFQGETLSGWSSLTISVWFLGGLILFSLGVIGEYIGKIYLETKKRPSYFIEKISKKQENDSHDPKNKENFFYLFLVTLSLLIPAIILFGLSLASLVVHSNMDLSAFERSSYTTNNVWFYLTLILMLLFLVSIQKILAIVSEKTLFIFCSVILVLFGFVLIFGSFIEIRSDARTVWETALQISHGNFSSLENSSYIGAYPFQLGLVTHDRILSFIHPSPRVLYITNLFMVLGINFFSWKLFSLLPLKNNLSNKYFILLTFLFFPQLFFIMFGYGTIPGFFFFVTSCFFSTKFIRSKKYYFLFVSVATMVVSCLLKNNYIIGALSLACVYILFFLKKKHISFLLYAFLLLLISLNATNFLINYYSYNTGITISKGMPKILWVNMGLQNDPNSTLEGGWYNGYPSKVYHEANFDPIVASTIGKQDFKQEIKRMVNNPRWTLKFFTKKIVSTWLEPTYQSIWSGPIFETHKHPSSIVKNIYSGGRIFEFLVSIMHIFMVFIFGFSAYYYFLCLKHIKSVNLFSILPGIYFTVGFLFHLAWETKSQYVYTYVFLLIIPACLGFMDAQDKIKKRLLKNQHSLL